MRPDVVDLRDFYASPLGLIAKRQLRRHLRTLWPDIHGQNLLGLGYATPFLSAFQGEAERLVALMPAAQGVTRWPQHGPNRVSLVSDAGLPLPDASFERVLLVHALEHGDHARQLLREVWRVMTADARLILIVPNRTGIWCRLDRTPFGHGLPYSSHQLDRLLRDVLLQPLSRKSALIMPPFQRRFMLRTAPLWEHWGAVALKTFAGVHVIEADKQIYAISATPKRRAHPIRAVIAQPSAQVRRQYPKAD